LGFADANLMSNDFIYSAEYDGIDEKKERVCRYKIWG
jgi:hypothetical protein